MKLNTYGIKMHGLKTVSGESKSLKGFFHGGYLELFYDIKSGDIWSIYQYSYGHNLWTVYHDDNVIRLGNIYTSHTMQELADIIIDRLEYVKELKGE